MLRTATGYLVASIAVLGAPVPEAPAQETPASLETAARDAERAGRLSDAFSLHLRAVQSLPDPAPLDPDIRLRASLIGLARRIEPRPVPSKEAERLAARGQLRFLNARGRGDLEEAAAELRQAVRAAPWAADFAYHLALVDEQLEAYRLAAANLRLYLLTNPADSGSIQDKLDELELRAQKTEAVLANPIAAATDGAPGIRRPDVNFVPTPQDVIEAMLDLANVGTADVVYDLGCGDGRIVIAAAKRGAHGVGIDLDARVIAEAQANARAAGVEDRVQFNVGDLFQADISKASVVTLYLLPGLNLKLRPKLLAELAPGTRVVSHAFDMSDWAPERAVQVGNRHLYLWRVPANRTR
jgi:tetratricopeptide (TPR) repeat protein